jgi:non-canonical purine NTP pyrophosphatase (RdgB/HAM1 family)
MAENIYFITSNENKFNEARKIIPRLVQLDIDLVEIQSLNAREIIEAKFIEAKKSHSGPFIVEDTSLYLNCLNGLPGPLIKWFVARVGARGLYDIVTKHDEHTASAKTIIGYCDAAGEIQFFEGAITGNIVAPQGETTFGWDPIFVPDGYDLTFAQMTKEQKNNISMRTIACQKLFEYITTST